MLTSINIKEVKKLKRFHTNNLNTNSKLYTDGKYIYKLVKTFPDDLKEILEKVSENDYDFVVKPKHLIEKNGELVGYSTQMINEETLFNYRHRPLELKKKDLVKAFDLVDKIAENGFTYSDFHPGNVLVDKEFNKLTLCDIDTLREKTDNYSIRRHYLNGFGLLLSYYYNVTGQEAEEAVYHGTNELDADDLFRDNINAIGNSNIKQKIKRFENMDESNYKYYRKEVLSVLNDRAELGYIKDF